MNKYELTDEFILRSGVKLHRIRALKDFKYVEKGDLGGYIESESNLSHKGNCWVYDNAEVHGNARVYDNANVHGNVTICGNAEVHGNAFMSGGVKIYDYVEIYGNVKIYGNVEIYDNATICGNAILYDNAKVHGYARVYDNATIFDNVEVYGTVGVYGNATICGNVEISSPFDYMVFKNSWSSERFFTYTKPNKMWRVGCFYGTGEELIAKAYKDSKLSGDCYKEYVDFVKRLENLCDRN